MRERSLGDMVSALTLGVEEELHLVDPHTSRLVPRAPRLLARLPAESFGAELQRTTVETNTAVHTTLDGLRTDIVGLRRRLLKEADQEGLVVAAVGTPPASNAEDFELTSTGRFGRMQRDYRLLIDEQLICGLQVHVGVPNRDAAIDVVQRISADLPLLLALSASSPFWNGADTGYSSIRTIIWQRWPTAGSTGPLKDAAEYDDLLADLIASGVIADAKMAYFDVRPSAHAPTVELRVCDATPLVDDAILIAGLFRGLVAAALQAGDAKEPYRPIAAPMARAATWRAARSGLTGDLLDHADHAQPIPAADAIRGLLDRVRPQLTALGDFDRVSDLLETTLARGNSADRQRAAMAERGRLSDVVDQVVAETSGAVDTTPVRGAPRRYPARAGDEVFRPNGDTRPAYTEVINAVLDIGLDDFAARGRQVLDWTEANRMTFGVGGEQRPFPVDLVPRIVTAHEWGSLTAGLVQRARAIEFFLQDAYGPARLLADGVLPFDSLAGCQGWQDEGTRLPAGTVRAPVMGFDLVRNSLGSWFVLEDNVRVPSGVAFSMALREIMDDIAPDLPRPAGLRTPAGAPNLLARTLRACAPETPGRLGLLSDGQGNSAWFEHRMLADRAGLRLMTPDDVRVTDKNVTDAGGHPLDVLYLRLDVELRDLVTSSGKPVGAAIIEAAAAGRVVLANTPGTGLADDKAMYVHVPDLIGYYLGERPLLDSVPTYRCADPAELQGVLERVGELVSKPIDGYGGKGVLIGPTASAAAVAARRREIVESPERWVAQELVNLSAHPTFTSRGLQPRHVDLRVFAYLSGTGVDDVEMLEAGLTRVAAGGSMVVNSSQGGGAKDTWIITDPSPEEQHVRSSR